VISIIDKLERNGYVATDKDIEQLAEAVQTGARGNATYLRVLVASVQVEIQSKRKLKQMVALERTHERMYEIVKRALGEQGNTIFARTAASTLRSWMRVAGNDVRELEPAEVTKTSLRVASGKQRSFGERIDRFVKAAAEAGEKAIQEAIEQLQMALTEVRENTDDERPRAH